MAEFRGRAFHTSDWPREPLELAGKRVGVIGTGATAVQLIPVGRRDSGPPHRVPAQPELVRAAAQRSHRRRRPRRGSRPDTAISSPGCRASHGAFIHDADRRKAMEVSPEEREAFYEKLYSEPGFGIWMGNFPRQRSWTRTPTARCRSSSPARVRERVQDPETAEKLVPKDHGFGTRPRAAGDRLLRSLQPGTNVALVDLNEAPIERITPDGIVSRRRGAQARHPGLCNRVRRRDRGLRPHRLPGLQRAEPEGKMDGRTEDLPRASRSPASRTCSPSSARTTPPPSAIFPRCSEQNVEWVADCIRHHAGAAA